MLKNTIFTPLFIVKTHQNKRFSQQKEGFCVNYILEKQKFIDEIHTFILYF